LSERSLREELAQAGFEQAKMFSWDKTASETLEVYKSVLS
jgi:glycosyltransferase involved in cell wall biosynthesis